MGMEGMSWSWKCEGNTFLTKRGWNLGSSKGIPREGNPPKVSWLGTLPKVGVLDPK